MADKTELSDEEIDAAWEREKYQFSGIDKAAEWYRAFARRVIAAERKRLANLIRKQFDHVPNDDCGSNCWAAYKQGQEDARIVEGS